jgi:predicted acylesterase/phospholipase RssA
MTYLGALKYIYQEKMDKDIIHVCGASAGALYGAGFVLGIPIDVMEETMKKVLKEETSKVDLNKVILFYKEFGIDDGSRIVNIIKLYAKNMTFLDLAKTTGKNLIVCATHVSTMTPTFFSVETTPNVLIVDAVRASLAIPFLISPVQIGDEFYIDGGATYGIPVTGLPTLAPKESTLVIYVTGKPISIDVKNTNMLAYIGHILQSMLLNHTLNAQSVIDINYPYTIHMKDIPVPVLPIVITHEYMYFCVEDNVIDECTALGYTSLYNKMNVWSQDLAKKITYSLESL